MNKEDREDSHLITVSDHKRIVEGLRSQIMTLKSENDKLKMGTGFNCSSCVTVKELEELKNSCDKCDAELEQDYMKDSYPEEPTLTDEETYGVELKKWTPEQIKKLKLFWRSAKESRERYYEMVDSIETVMKASMDIPELEFFYDEYGVLQGIGNQWAEYGDKYELLQEEDFDD